jgi:hypothetical protein
MSCKILHAAQYAGNHWLEIRKPLSMDLAHTDFDLAFWTTVVAILLLLVLSAFFSGSETALTAASRGKLHAQAD